MQVFSDGKSWIGVLVVAVALGDSASCQKRRSTPKSEPQRSIETPNGKGKEVCSRTDNPDSSTNDTANLKGGKSTSTTETDGIRMNNNCDEASTSRQDVSITNGSSVGYVEAGLGNNKNLSRFFSSDGSNLKIDSGSELWGYRGFTGTFGTDRALPKKYYLLIAVYFLGVIPVNQLQRLYQKF